MSLVLDGTNGVTFNNSSTQSVGAVGAGSQTWQNLTASRALSTTYTNSTGLSIQVLFCGGGNGTYVATVNSVSLTSVVQVNQTGVQAFIVPNGQTYQITGATVGNWSELR